MTGRAPVIIGISGVTNSGKTSLTNKIRAHLPGCRTICQDTYFLDPPDPRLTPIPELDHYNFDELNALDMEAMVADVQSWKDAQSNSTPVGSTPDDMYSNVLIVEGFRMYALRDLEQLLMKKYFCTIPYDVCIARRGTRHYTPPDKPGYFEKIVWPESILHQREIQDQDDIEYLDGSGDQDELCLKIVCDIKQLCNDIGNCV
ncbi:nicotinamide riboside kinase 1-like isoform X1 [Saccostrea echinata]|uniref:nicotinamide riboside kinase 1-like isoform X1 n=1 Tax=Saccostrea echinata TaxID=191078 RepID=UPI002A7EF28C|nr:nicotinamide riboside kinase 1-like isoform X1 [Saccostrea echinata]